MNPEGPAPHESESEPYWHDDVGLGEVELQDDVYPLRLRLHRSREQYRERRELVPLRHPAGERLYLHARPYILIPDLQLAVEVSAAPFQTNGNGAAMLADQLIGAVVSAERVGRRPRELGNAQGWCYPDERLIVLWECYLYDWCRRADPLQDAALGSFWQSFEHLLARQLPVAAQIVTPAWEHLYLRERWQAFLAAHGFGPSGDEPERVFIKELPRR